MTSLAQYIPIGSPQKFGVTLVGLICLASLIHILHVLMVQQQLGIGFGVFVIGVIGGLALVAGQGLKAMDQDPTRLELQASASVSNLVSFATDMFWETDTAGTVTHAGGRLMQTIAPDLSSVIGRHYLEVVTLDNTEMQKMMRALQKVEPYSDILSIFYDTRGRPYYISLSATPRYGRDGKVCGYFGVGTNVTERIRTQARMKHMAEHDMLTGLANRYAFQKQIEQDLLTCQSEEGIALLVLDLDEFKAVNDTYGHQAGDALLNLVAKRLRSVIRSDDWAARLGGDEFVVVSRHITNAMDACLVAARLTKALSKPYRVGGVELGSKASIGIACAPVHADNATELMKAADLALYQAKADGRGCYRLYTADIQASSGASEPA